MKHGAACMHVKVSLRYVTCSTQQGVGSPLGANERLIGVTTQSGSGAAQLQCVTFTGVDRMQLVARQLPGRIGALSGPHASNYVFDQSLYK
jgi:hypothetical protein